MKRERTHRKERQRKNIETEKLKLNIIIVNRMTLTFIRARCMDRMQINTNKMFYSAVRHISSLSSHLSRNAFATPPEHMHMKHYCNEKRTHFSAKQNSTILIHTVGACIYALLLLFYLHMKNETQCKFSFNVVSRSLVRPFNNDN